MPRTGIDIDQPEDAEIRYMRLWHRAQAIGADIHIVIFPRPIEEYPGFLLADTPPADLQSALDVVEIYIKGGENTRDYDREKVEFSEALNALILNIKETHPEPEEPTSAETPDVLSDEGEPRRPDEMLPR